MRMLSRAVLLVLIGCGSTPPPATAPPAGEPPATTAAAPADAGPSEPEPAPTPPRLATVTVISGEIQGRMANGEQWDEKEHKDHRPVDRALSLYIQGHPELADTTATLGVPIDAAKLADEARKTPAADPMVLVQVGDRVFRSPVRPRAFNPLWEFPFQIVVGPDRIAADETVHIHVVDYDSPTRFDTIGTTVITVEELLAKPLHRLGKFGGVEQLTLQVETMELPEPPPEPSVFRIAVPGNASWTDTGLDVIAGQRVTIDAADEVCTHGSNVNHCSGPEGQRKVSSYSLPGFEMFGLGTLVAAIGDTRFPVKRSRSFVAPASGRLRLGVNDSDPDNNRGSFAVRVTVAAP